MKLTTCLLTLLLTLSVPSLAATREIKLGPVSHSEDDALSATAKNQAQRDERTRITGQLQQAEEDMRGLQGMSYHDLAFKRYMNTHGEAEINGCLETYHGSRVSNLRFLLVLNADGTPRETENLTSAAVSRCVMQSLAKEKWPMPPFAPFHMLITLQLGRSSVIQ